MWLHEVVAAATAPATGYRGRSMLGRFHLSIPQWLAHRLATGGILESRTLAALLLAAAVGGVGGWLVLRRRGRRAQGGRRWRWGGRASLVAGAVLGLLSAAVGVNSYAGSVPTVGAAVALAAGQPAFAPASAIGDPAATTPTSPRVTAGARHHDAVVGHAQPSTVVDLALPAPALGMPNGNAYVYLPADYTTARRYPVLYLLGGAPGAPSDWLYAGNLKGIADSLIGAGYVQPLIVVMPRISPVWSVDYEALNALHGPHVMTFLTKVVVPAVDARFATIATRADRAIAGFSAGADGAMNTALHHQSLFATVGAIEPGGSPGAHATWVLANNPKLLWQNSAIDYIPSLAFPQPMTFYLSAGSLRRSGPVPRLARELRARGQVVVVHDESGYGHTWTDARNDLPYLLQFTSNAFGSTPRPA